jgi:glutamine amidotransferase-like uncharacterized protein
VAAEHRPRIAVYGQAGPPYHYIAIFAGNGYSASAVFAEEIRAGALSAFDVFVIPGGGFDGMEGQIEPLGHGGAAAISAFVRSGGMYLGSCAGAYDAADPAPDFQRRCPAQPAMRLLPARVWNEDRDRWRGLESPGVGRIRVRNDFPAHPVMAGMPSEFEIVHYNGPIFAQARSLVSVTGSTEDFTASEDFLGPAPDGPKMMERAAEAGLSVTVAGEFGEGRAVLFGCHPEFGFSLGPMDDAQQPSRMIINALQWQAEARAATAAQAPLPLCSAIAAPPADPGGQVASAIEGIRAEISALGRKSLDLPWLSAPYAMSVFGKPAPTVWEGAIASIPQLLDDIQEIAPTLPTAILNFEPPTEWKTDFGYAGVLPLLARAQQMLARACASWDDDLGPPSTDPYTYIRTSPYHLVAGSYLAAIGHITGAALLCRCPPGRLNS